MCISWARLLLLFIACPLLADNVKLESKVLGETREIIVHLPDSYAASRAAYPVLYVLDGGSNHLISAAASSFLSNYGEIPELIVVAIKNTNRNRDFTPEQGAPKFLQFLRTELVPKIDASYRTRPLRVLAGHSLGGLFAVWAMSAQPDAFFAWIALDPAFWWNNNAVITNIRKLFEEKSDLRTRLVVFQSGQSQKRRGDWPVPSAPKNVRMTTRVFADETHGSLPYRGIYEALRVVFSDYVSQAMTVADLEKHYAELSAAYGYRVPIPEMAWFELVYRAEDARNWDEAARALDKLTGQYPNNPEIPGEKANLESMRRGDS